MRIRRDGYSSLDWTDALSKKNQKDPEHEVAEGSKEDDKALEQTAKIMYDLPTDKEAPKQALADASKQAADASAAAKEKQAVDAIKQKLSSHGVDPVSLGICSKEQWEAIPSAAQAEVVAKQAALKAKQRAGKEWERRAAEELGSAKKGMKPDVETSKAGRIAPTTSMTDDTSNQRTAVPANAASIFDPDRIAKMAEQPNAHDASVAASREREKSRQAEKKGWRTEQVPDDVVPMKAGQVIKAGGEDRDVGRYKAPANQVSMADDIKGATPEEIREKLAGLFTTRIPDTAKQIKDANAERKAQIQRPPEKKEEIKVQKPVSTKDITSKLAEMWMPQKPDEPEKKEEGKK